MNRKLVLIVALLLSGLSFQTKAQGVSCPPNIDFELGTYAFWNYYVGTCCPLTTPTGPAPVVGQHTLRTGAGTDFYGAFPVVPPGAGAYTLQLGNSTNGGFAERARYYIPVPTGTIDYSLLYRYSIVLEDPSHTPTEQPRFEVNAYDSATGAPIPCAQFNYVATSTLPGFILSTSGGSTYYHDWALGSINLSGLGGTTVAIDFASGDCGYGGHFGYGYIDLSCGLWAINTVACDQDSITLNAPPGFQSYRWFDSLTFSTLYGSTTTITIVMPTVATTFAVIIEPYVGFGCPDTLYTEVIPSRLRLNMSNDTTLCAGTPVTFYSGATDVAPPPLTYVWTPSTGLCSTCADIYVAPTASTTYTVVVTNSQGCTATDTVRYNAINQITANIFDDSVTCYGGSDGRAWVQPTSGTPPYTYIWSTAPVQTTDTAFNLDSGLYTVVVNDVTGCADTLSIVVEHPAKRRMAIIDVDSPTTCLGRDGRIIIRSVTDSTFRIGEVDTIVYTFYNTLSIVDSYDLYKFSGGVLTPGVVSYTDTQIVTIPPAGYVFLTGLPEGVYTNIHVATQRCTVDTILGPIILADPPHPDAPVMTSNSVVCENDTIKLTATTAMAGVGWNWTGPAGFTAPSQNTSRTPALLIHDGYYAVTADRNRCYTTDSIRVRIQQLPVPVATNNSTLCSGDTLRLHGTSTTGSSSYWWDGPSGFYSNEQDPFIGNVQVTANGTYTVIVTWNGCWRTTTTDVVINQTPPAPEVVNLDYCQFDAAPALTALGTGGSLLWYTTATGGTGSAVAPVPSTSKPAITTWYVSEISASGCEGKRSAITVNVHYKPEPILITTDSVICRGNTITFNASNTGADNTGIYWYFGYGDTTKNVNPISHSFDGIGTYTVTATTLYNVCPQVAVSKAITIYPSPSINLGLDTTICPGGEAIILTDLTNVSAGNARWKWSTGEVGPTITVTEPGVYYTVVTINGCTATDTVNVANDCYISLPNVFSPNGDGVNDYFFPRDMLTRGLTSFRMDIYNRWGQLIFKTNGTEGRGWDGKLNGVPQPEGVYVFIIDATFKDGQKEHHQGNITLLR